MASVIVIGIDPGVTGAIACVHMRGHTVEWSDVRDIPTYKHQVGPGRHGKFETLVETHGLRELLAMPRWENPSAVAIERPLWINDRSGRAKDSSQTLSLSLINYGRVTGCLHHFADVYPSTWKRDVGVTSDKTTSLQLARAIFPNLAETFLSRRKDHDRAEALLIAHWAYWHLWAPAAHVSCNPPTAIRHTHRASPAP